MGDSQIRMWGLAGHYKDLWLMFWVRMEPVTGIRQGRRDLTYILKGRITVATRAAACRRGRCSFITVITMPTATIPSTSVPLPPAHAARALWVLSRQTPLTHMQEQGPDLPATGWQESPKCSQKI